MSINDDLFQKLGEQGYEGSLNDRMFKKLRGDGYTGSLSDMLGQVGGGKSWKEEIATASPNLVPTIDFTQWYNVPLSPMDSVTTDTFTNVGTGYIQLDIGAEAGEVYTITINQTRGAGTCLIYLAAEQGVTQADEVWGLEGGEETITLVADGPWLTFRASVGDTTTTVTELRVVKTSKLKYLIDKLFSDSAPGAFYQPDILVNNQQALFQNSDGTVAVPASGGRVGYMVDASGNGNHAYQDGESARPSYPGLIYSGAGEWLKTDLAIDSDYFGPGFLWCFWSKWASLESNTGSNGGAYQNPRLYTQMVGGGGMRVAVGDQFATLVTGVIQDEWMHVAVYYDGATVRPFLNKVAGTTMGAVFAGNTVEAFRIGQGFEFNREMNGAIGSQFIVAGDRADYEDLINLHYELGP